MSASKPVFDHIVKSKFGPLDFPKRHLVDYLLTNAPASTKDKPAFIDAVSGISLTHSEIALGIRAFAAALHSLSYTPTLVLAICIPNTIYYPILVHSVGLLGGIPTTANPAYTPTELAHQLNDSGATVLVTNQALIEIAKAAVKLAPKVKKLILVPSVPVPFGTVPTATNTASESKSSDDIETLQFLDLLALGSTPSVLSSLPPTPTISPTTTTALLPYSSGTTGLQKGVELTHYNLVANLLQVQNILNFKAESKLLAVLPFFHLFAHQVIMNAGLAFGLTVVVVSSFDPAGFLGSVQKYKITHLLLVPPIFVFLAKHPIVDKFDLTTVKELFSGAAPMGHDLESQIRTRFPWARLRQGYGLTETSPATHISPDDSQRPGSVGVGVANVETVIVDLTTGKSLPSGATNSGELWVRGPNILKGYLNNEEATKYTIDADGWFHTGDIGYYDADEHFYIVDRLKELIKCKGYQVAPAELESLLLSHPKIADCAVIQREDERCGEIPVAYVVKKEADLTAVEVEEYIASRVADHKRLRGGVRFVEKVIKSASGKILRRVMKAEEAKLEPATTGDAK